MDNVQVLLKVCGSVLRAFNPWITEQQKLPTFTELGTFCTHIF